MHILGSHITSRHIHIANQGPKFSENCPPAVRLIQARSGSFLLGPATICCEHPHLAAHIVHRQLAVYRRTVHTHVNKHNRRKAQLIPKAGASARSTSGEIALFLSRDSTRWRSLPQLSQGSQKVISIAGRSGAVGFTGLPLDVGRFSFKRGFLLLLPVDLS